jgi:multiple sugar transport system permease protein
MSARIRASRGSRAGGVTRRGYVRGLAALAATAGAPLPAACAGRESVAPAEKLQGKLDLWLWARFWSDGSIGDAFVKEFAQQYPELTVSRDIPADWRTKVPAAAAAGAPPDMSYMDRYLAAEWGTNGIAQALDGSIKGSKVLVPSDWRDGLRSDVTWKGKLYAVPQTSEPWVFFWNQAVFREAGLDPTRPPATWDELKASTTKVYRADERYGFLPNYGNGGTQAAWLIFLWQQGQDELSPDRTKAIFNNDKGLRALEQVVDFVKTQGGLQRFTEFRTNAGPQGAVLLPAGKVAMHFDANSQPAIWRQSVPETNYGVDLLPKPPGGQDTTYQGGPSYIVPAGARNATAALRFMEYFMSRENELRTANAFGSVPTSKTVAQSNEYLSKAPERKVYTQLALGAKWVPVVPGAQEILTIHQQFTADALNAVKSPLEALSWAQAEIQKVLDKYIK